LLFSLLISGYLGISVKDKFNVMINERSFYINIFIISSILMYILNINLIHLDNTIINISLTLDNEVFNFTGKAINELANLPPFVNIGNGLAFTLCANIARGLVVKTKIGLIPKMVFIIASGTGGGIAMNLVRSVNNLGAIENNINLIKIAVNEPRILVNENLSTLNDSSNNFNH
jgi:hypothetical protein